jgi:hypothetical protein
MINGSSKRSDDPVGAAPAGTSSAGSAELIGYCRVEWSVLCLILGEAPAAWADYDGFHIGQVPSAPPPYTHLWAWTEQWLVRARIDGDQAIVGVLVLSAAPAGAPAAKITETVSFERAAARTWTEGEQRVGPMPAEVADREVDIFLVSGEHPVTFVSAGPAT